MSLETALHDFAEAFAGGSKNIGMVELRAPLAIAEPIPLGPVLKDYYARLRMSEKPQVGGALYLALFTLDQLERAQHGWRWVTDKDGTVKEEPGWNKHWVVVADRHGDAIIVDDSRPGGTVFGNIGSVNFKIADDLASFFQAMAQAMVIEVKTFDYEVYDDDFNPEPAFLDAMRAVALRELGAEGETGFMKFFFG